MYYFKKRLFWKFFFSYFALVLISIIVLGIVLRILLPGVFDSHLASMTRLFSRHGMEEAGHMGMGGHGIRMMGWSTLFTDLFAIFNRIIFEATLYAILPSVLIALVLSVVMSRQLVRPLQQMTYAADRIAAGHYTERLPEDAIPLEAQDELGQLAVRFNRMTEQLEQVEDMRQKLVGDVAHELRTPLTVIKGSLEGLMDGVMPPDEHTYERIFRQVARMDRLVNDLQELNRIEEGIIELKIKPVDAVKLLTNLVETMQMNYSAKNVALNLHISKVPVMMKADEDRVEQVMINLLSNALQATPAGGQVFVQIEKTGELARISVADTGIGIAPEHLEKVFSRFYRVDESRSRQAGGSGIGLTVTKKLVEAMKGRIWAESAGHDQGTVFTFTLPLV
jgi:two-component system, OmpR family, sensor histidine kinase BaeS